MSVIIVLSAAFTAGIAVGSVIQVPREASLLCTAFCCALIILLWRFRRTSGFALLLSTFIAGITRSAAVEHANEPSPPDDPPCQRYIEGRIRDQPLDHDSEKKFSIELSRWSGCLKSPTKTALTPARGSVHITVRGKGRLLVSAGDQVLVWGMVRPPRVNYNLGDDSRPPTERTFFMSLSHSTQIARLKTKSTLARRAFDRSRARLARFWRDHLPRELSNLARALSLGESRVLDHEQREIFQNTGTSHLLAVSGFHLWLNIYLIFALLRALLLRITSLAARFEAGRIAALFAIPAALALTGLTGARVPVVRACFMAVSALLARALCRSPGTGEAFAVAAVFILIDDPLALKTASFQLSFTAVAAFLLVLNQPDTEPVRSPELAKPASKPIRLLCSLKKKLLDISRSTLAAIAATTPLALIHFGRVSLLAFPANLLALPLAAIWILPLLLFATPTILLWPALASSLVVPIAAGLACLQGLLTHLASLAAPLDSPTPTRFSAIVLLCLAVLACLAAKKKLLIAAAAGSGIAFCLSFVIDSPNFEKGKLTLDFLDIGQGDATLITFPNGTHWLVDTGGLKSEHFDVGERIVVPVLRSLGVERIHTLVLSHPDHDHIGGLPGIMSSLAIGRIWDNGQGEAETAPLHYRFGMEQARRDGIPVERTPELCGTKRIADVRIEVIHPCNPGHSHDPLMSFNNNSLVISFRYGAFSALLTGDIEHEAEQLLMSKSKVPMSSILKIAHHGSPTSSGKEFLDHVRPKVAVISAGRHNPLNLPHRSVLDKLKRKGIRIFRTDKEGGIRVVADKSAFRVSSSLPSNAFRSRFMSEQQDTGQF